VATKERMILESMFMIADKEGKDVDFRLNSAQIKVDQRLSGRDIVPKARQEGVSSYFLGRYTVKCLGQRNTRAVVISHDKESTQRMLSRVHYYIKNIRGPPPVIKTESKNELSFPKTNSMFYIGTAGARKFGRGDTITHLHCSEAAYWDDPKKLTAGLFQAVPKGGEIAIESTGNGVGNWYHKLCTRAANGQSRFRLHFLSWTDFDEYTHDLTPAEAERVLANLDPEFDEIELAKVLTPGQLSWRREKLEEFDYDQHDFEQEYPMTLDECFQSSGHSIFHRVKFVKTDLWRKEGELSWLEGHPIRDHVYAFGVDVSAGVGRDNSVIEGFDIMTGDQVVEWVSNRIEPDHFATKIDALAREFNMAFIVVESNNHGILTLHELLDSYEGHLIYRDPNRQDNLVNAGWRTTPRTKPIMIGSLRTELKNFLIIHSPLLRSELSTFTEKEDGKLEAEEGCMDDRVIASGCAVAGFTKAALNLPASGRIIHGVDPMSLDAIIDELHGSRNEYPVRDQAAITHENTYIEQTR